MSISEEMSIEGIHGQGEKRWPMALVLLVAMALPFLLPPKFSLGPVWIVPAIEVLLLLALVRADPGRIDRRSTLVRSLSVGLVAILVVGAGAVTTRLVVDLIRRWARDQFARTTTPSRCSHVGLCDHHLFVPLLGARW